MIRSIVAIVFILLAGGSWFYLDRLNKQEQDAAAEVRKTMEHNRALALAAEKARAEARAQFETQLQNDLNACNVAAEQTSSDYLTLHQKPVPRKPGQFTIPQEVAAEAAKLLEAAHAQCQSTYDSRFKSGT